MEKIVLVRLQTPAGDRNRPVTFCGGKSELLSATMEKFSDILAVDGQVYLQILYEQEIHKQYVNN